mgnify:CR=1 FL=1
MKDKIDSKNKHTHDFNATLGTTLTTKESNNPSNNETNKEDKKISVGGNASLDIKYDFKNDDTPHNYYIGGNGDFI